MTGYVVVISPDASGIPQGKTYFLDSESRLLAVVALLEGPPEQQKKVRVLVNGLNVRGGPNEVYRLIRSLRVGDVLPVLAEVKDLAGNDWVRIAENEWICRVYQGRIKAEYT